MTLPSFSFDALVYLSLVAVGFLIWYLILIISKAPENDDLDVRRIRFAGAALAGIMLLFVFAASLYFSGESVPGSLPNAPTSATTINRGKEIFEKAMTAMFTLAGSILGYVFGASRQSMTSRTEKNAGSQESPASQHTVKPNT